MMRSRYIFLNFVEIWWYVVWRTLVPLFKQENPRKQTWTM
jgi:hypothetical protein